MLKLDKQPASMMNSSFARLLLQICHRYYILFNKDTLAKLSVIACKQFTVKLHHDKTCTIPLLSKSKISSL